MSKDELLSTLYNRHAAALSVVAMDGNQRVHVDAARMALALIVRELADKLPDIHQANGGNGEKRVDLRTYEWLEGQIVRIDDWLVKNEVGFYNDPDTDTADAIIAAASGTRSGLASALAENRRLQEQLQSVDAENARLRKIETFLREELADANRRAAVLVQAFDAGKPSIEVQP